MQKISKQQSLVTIVIPTHNGSRYLKHAINSVLKQDYPNTELIVLDDGSTDDTQALLKNYGDSFYHEWHKNIGQAETLNKGWRMSKGEILSYLSADDILMPNAVSAAVQCLNEYPNIVLTYCDFNLIDPNSRFIRKVTSPDFNYLDMVKNIVCQPGPGVFFRKWAFERTGSWCPEFQQMPDYDYWLRLGLHGPFKRIPNVFASFRIHDKSMTFSTCDRIRASEPVRIIERFYSAQKNLPDNVIEVYPVAISNAHLISAQLHLRSGRVKDALSAIKKAILLSKKNVLSIRGLRILFNALFNRMFHRILWHIKQVVSGEFST